MYKKFVWFWMIAVFALSVKGATVTGKLVSGNDNQPVEFARVFLAGTTFCTLTNEKGEFILQVNRPGVYTLSVSHLSYESFSMEITIGQSDLKGLVVRVKERPKELASVTVKNIDPNREQNLKIFIGLLFGNSKNAKKCTLKNPGAIHFYRDPNNKFLKGFADSLLVIENAALGYTIHYMLFKFYTDVSETVLYGVPYFEDVSGNLSGKARMMERRNEAYFGSIQHFMRSLFSNTIQLEGFTLYRVTEEPMRKGVKYGILTSPVLVKSKGKYLEQTSDSFSVLGSVFADSLPFAKHLQYFVPFRIVYNKDKEEYRYREDQQFWILSRKRNQQTTLVRVKDDEGLTFYKNGAYQTNGLVLYGYMGWKAFANALPFNFDPDVVPK